MHRKPRPARCAPGSITNARELGERLRLSRERLAASEIASIGRAWRLWGACVEATVGYSRSADHTYAATLARAAGIDRWAAADLLRQFNALGVVVWKAAPQGTRAMSELELPSLDTWRPDHLLTSHVVPTPPVERPTGGAHASLQGNTHEQDVESSESHRSIGTAKTVAPQTGETRTGTPESGTTEAGRALEELTREDLDRAAYKALVEGDKDRLDAVRNEVHRRDVSHSALAMFSEPMEARRRPE